jgi:hypothetical protein
VVSYVSQKRWSFSLPVDISEMPTRKQQLKRKKRKGKHEKVFPKYGRIEQPTESDPTQRARITILWSDRTVSSMWLSSVSRGWTGESRTLLYRAYKDRNYRSWIPIAWIEKGDEDKDDDADEDEDLR